MRNYRFIYQLLVLCLCVPLYSQSRVDILGVDPSNYPEIRAEVKVFDNNGDDARGGLRTEDFIITDGGTIRPAKNVLCDNTTRKFSLILTIDRSASMLINKPEFGGRSGRDIALDVAENFIDQFPTQNGEFGITYFSAGNVDPTGVLHEFSQDKQSLKQSLNSLYFVQETDYNKGFLGDTVFSGDDIVEIKEGVVNLAARAKYSTFVIFITDGLHSVGIFDENGIVTNMANAMDLTIYPVSLGLPLPDKLNNLAGNTGGFVGDNFTSDTEFENFYLTLLENATQIADPAPCELIWDADCISGDLTIEYNNFGNPNASTTYDLPVDKLPYLEFSTPEMYFTNDGFNTNATKQITLTARNNFVDLNGYTSTDPRYTVTGNLNRRLNKDESTTVDVVFNSSIREFIETDLVFEGSACTKTAVVKSEFIFAKDVNVGGETLGQTAEYTATQTFCNYSDRALNVTNLRINGGNAADFDVLTNPKQFTIPPNTCIEIEFEFKPTDQGVRTSRYFVDTENGTYDAEITGTGGGQAVIQASDPSVLTVNCEDNQDQVVIPISNTGQIPLNVSTIDIIGTDKDDFDVNPTTHLIPVSESRDITVTFSAIDPSQFGNRTAQLRINNDSQNDQALLINLSGLVENVGITVDKSSIDFGVLCPGESVQENIEISNATGSLGDFTVDLLVNNNYYNLSDASIYLNSSGSETTTVSFSTNDIGTYIGTYTLTDACGAVTEVALNAIVSQPELQIVSGASLTSNIGEPTISQIEVQNNSEHILTITNGSISNTQVTFVNDLSTNPVVIQPNTSEFIDVRYLPTENSSITPDITLETDKCNYVFNGSLSAQPGLLSADLVAPNVSALVGEQFTMELLLNNKTQGFEVLSTDAVSFDLVYDSRYLTYVDAPGINAVENVDNGTNLATLTVTDYPIANDAEDIIYLDFLTGTGVLGVNSIPVNIQQPSAEGYVINDINGTFEILKVQASISVEDKVMRTGNVFSFPIIVDDEGDNLRDFHTGLSGKVTYNPLVLIPIGNQYDIEYNADFTSAVMTFEENVDFSNPNVVKNETIQDVESFLVTTLEFKVLYGNEHVTTIEVEEVNSINGSVDIEDSTATIEITDICEYQQEGSYRYVIQNIGDPLNASVVNASPNSIEFAISTVEETEHDLTVYDQTGKVIHRETGFRSPGKHSLTLSGMNLPAGIYYVSLAGYTASVSKPFVIVR